MGVSFEDSLKKIQEEMYAPATMSLRTVSEDTATVMALTEDTSSWTLNTDYKYTDNLEQGMQYEDANISYVDDMKNVKINQFQVNLTQEENSQYIPFEMFRYYDGIDLMNMTLSVFFQNVDDEYGESPVINVRYNDTKIRFGWVVPLEATLKKGALRMEIRATGKNPFGFNYVLKTVPNSELNILESLHGNGRVIIDENWATNVLEDVKNFANDAQLAADQAQAALDTVNDTLNTTVAEAADAIRADLATTHYTKDQTDDAIKSAVDAVDVTDELDALEKKISDDVTAQLNEVKLAQSETDNEVIALQGDYADLKTSLEENYYTKSETFTQQEVRDLVDSVDVSEQLKDYPNREEMQEAIAGVDVTSQLEELETEIADNYYDSTEADEKFATKTELTAVETTANTNKADILTANAAIASINQTLDSIDKSPNAQYVTTYNEPYTLDGVEYTGENALVLYEVYYKDTEQETRTIISVHIIQGGSGGSSSANTIVIERITNTPLVVATDDTALIEYRFTGTDSSGEDIGQGTATWKLGSRVIKTESVYTGENSFDITEYLSVASDQKVTLTITDEIGTMQSKTWYVSVVDVKLESNFDDTKKYTANEPVSLTYTPYGAVDKTVHVLLDGEELGTTQSLKSAAGLSASYEIPTQLHGTHLVEIYMTATINNNTIESNHISKDIIWYDEESDVPVISCVQQDFTARQYEATNITYTVYDPSTETPHVTLKATYVNEDGETVEEYNSSLVMATNTDLWQFKSSVIGEHTLTITCGETVKTLKAIIKELGISVTPTTSGLEFDFNPVGYSNNDENRIWTDSNTGVAMTVSDNFDWVNGGYQVDDAGDQYFCVKAGTTATINYNLFYDDAKANGKEFKVIFKTTNVKNRNTSFISCMDYGIGLDMKVESANIYSSNGSLYSPYCEDDIIEFEFNINKSADIPMVMTYEDGVGNRPMLYTSDSSFWQTNATPITIGSPNCDVYIYRMKAYSTSLSDKDILNNFIADARSAEEMIARHTRNQIYKDGALNPEYLAEVCPDLRIILIDAPWFTNDKGNKVTDTNITMIYKNGDPLLDNWTCTGATHRGRTNLPATYGNICI